MCTCRTEVHDDDDVAVVRPHSPAWDFRESDFDMSGMKMRWDPNVMPRQFLVVS